MLSPPRSLSTHLGTSCGLIFEVYAPLALRECIQLILRGFFMSNASNGGVRDALNGWPGLQNAPRHRWLEWKRGVAL